MQFVDSDHPDVIAFAKEATAGATTDREKAVALFYAVRDGIRYDPYVISSEGSEAYLASTVLRDGVSYCIPKSVLLCAAARAVGLTARLGFADVRNHLNSPKLRERLGGTDLFVWHGYTEFFLDGRWVKVTSAFNIELCERFGVMPLEFDGEHDALLHPYTADGRDHMEYVRERGSFDELPLDEILEEFRATYPAMFDAAHADDAAFRPS
ncbi:MAG TPA: transglutaminase-like domain-containing protein [Acidimicrobiia bacterium]|nr:transglutaminase-like domain-containing protein [Acidimicrobiia bacterium]